MQQSTFYEEESIVPLHEKLKYEIVYLFYRFGYNIQTFQKGSMVYVLQEDYYNWYGGPWTRVEWNGNWYWTSPSKLKKL